MSDSVKIVYMILQTITFIFLLLLMVLSPIYITEGYYWWSAIAFIFLMYSPLANSERIDKWK